MQADDKTNIKRCTKCGLELDICEFHKDKHSVDGHYIYCKLCARARSQEYKNTKRGGVSTLWKWKGTPQEKAKQRRKSYYWNHRDRLLEKKKVFYRENKERYAAYGNMNSESRRWKNMRLNYGISREEFVRMWEEANGSCVVCKSPLELRRGGYAIDHNHTTKKVRGLLCGKCNNALGQVKDDIDILKGLIIYLESNG